MKSKPPRGSTPQPDHILLSLNGDERSCRAVTWRTCEEITEGYVEYRIAGTEAWLCAEGSHDYFESDIDVSQIHWARLQNLKPGTAYEYTCGDAAHRSPVYSFTTPPEKIEKFKFICFADQQKGEPFCLPDYGDFRRFCLQLLEEHPDTAFILTAGDNTDSGQHEQQWNALFATGLNGIAEGVPVMMQLGNHDNRGFRVSYRQGIGRYYSEPGEFFCKQFQGAYPDNGPAGWKTENYIFTYGDVQFNVVGLTGDEERNQWLLETTSKSNSQWKVSVWHFPVTHAGVDTEITDYPPLREGLARFDLAIAGHEHSFARSFPFRDPELYDRPSQGTVHYTLGNGNRNPPGSQTVAKIWHAAFFTMEERLSAACVVEVEGPRITLTSVLEDGRVLDRCVIDKENDVIFPRAAAPVFGPGRTRMLFKGMDLGLCQADTPCELKDNQWACPFAILVAYLGGAAEKNPGQCRLEVYRHWAVFTEGSAVAQTDQGDIPLPVPVYRGRREQLYIPVEACGIFGMRWDYAARNNFINFEHPSEDKPVTVQP